MFFAFFALILLGGILALLIRVERISSRIASLQSRLDRLEREKADRPIEVPTTAPVPAAATPSPIPRQAAEPPPARPAITPATDVAHADAVTARPVPTTVSPGPPPPQPSSTTVSPGPPAPRPSRTKEEWEALIGGKLLNRIGALALIIGIGFFLKYAFDNNWITETFRVLIGAGVGAVSLLLAARAEKKGFAVFAQGLVGAGLAILYLSVYASFNFYHLLSQLPAFLLMAAVTVLAFTQAFRYDSIAVSLLGWLGGFLTPFLLSTGENNHVGLFTYILLLDAGVMIVLSRKRSWSFLEPLAIAGTYLIYFSWYNEYYDNSLLTSTLAFVGLFWLLFHGVDLFLVLRSTDPTSDRRRLLAWGQGFLAFWASLLPLTASRENPRTEVWVVFACLYLVSAVPVLRLKPAQRATAIHYLLATIIILAAALFNEFERFALPIALGVEATAAVLLAWRLRSRPLSTAGETLLAVAFLILLAVPGAILYDPLALYSPVWNERFLAFIVILAASAAFAVILKRAGHPVEAEVSHYGWIAVLLIVLSVEINDIFRALSLNAPDVLKEAAGFQRTMVLSAAWIVVGLTFIALAGRGLLRPLLFAGSSIALLGSALAGIRGIAFVPVQLFVTIVNVRFAAILFIGAGGLLAASLLKLLRDRNSWATEFRFAFQIVVAVLGAILLTGEIRDSFEKIIGIGVREKQGSDELLRLENLKQLALSGGWLLYSILLMGIGLWRRIRAVRILAIGLFACTILKIFTYDLSFLETLYRFISFLALGVILLTVSYLYQRYRLIIFEPSRE